MLHIEIERERKFNICIEIQSHAQHIFPLLSEHIFSIVCAYTSAIVKEFYLFCTFAVSFAHIDTNWLISLSTFYFITEIISKNSFILRDEGKRYQKQ